MAFLPTESHALPKGAKVAVTATTAAYPGEHFAGTLTFLYPHVDQDTRTLTVRFELDDPAAKLPTGHDGNGPTSARTGAKMVANRLPRLKLKGSKVLAVPEGSVMDAGREKVVYRQVIPGEFEGVVVEVGPRLNDSAGVGYFPILAGLEAGEDVVAGGAFLIDAETRLNPAAGSIYVGGSTGSNKTAALAFGPRRRRTTPTPRSRPRWSICPRKNARQPGSRRRVRCWRAAGSAPMGIPVKLTLEGKTVLLC